MSIRSLMITLLLIIKNKPHWLWSMLTENSIGVISNILCNIRQKWIERLKEDSFKMMTNLIGNMNLVDNEDHA